MLLGCVLRAGKASFKLLAVSILSLHVDVILFALLDKIPAALVEKRQKNMPGSAGRHRRLGKRI
ncbi:MAG TPA: hypothetical protein DEA73_08335 [Peptococcaceae bacterium]|nr:hypothetical protein [Peptococcaceae bacterium]